MRIVFFFFLLLPFLLAVIFWGVLLVYYLNVFHLILSSSFFLQGVMYWHLACGQIYNRWLIVRKSGDANVNAFANVRFGRDGKTAGNKDGVRCSWKVMQIPFSITVNGAGGIEQALFPPVLGVGKCQMAGGRGRGEGICIGQVQTQQGCHDQLFMTCWLGWSR